MWGCQEGDKKPGGCLGPLLSPPPDGGSPRRGHGVPPPPVGGNAQPCHGEYPPAREGLTRLHRLRRWIGGKVCLLLPIGLLRIYKAFYKGFS